MNAAVHLPINSLDVSKSKFPWLETATHVLINTELSMFGKDILPRTRWDKLLNANHILPDYQPFEYLVSGGYMGEIVRLVLVEAVETAGLHRGLLPPKLKSTPYALDTKTLADIEAGDISERLSPRLPTDVFYQRPTFDIPESVYTNFLQPVIRSVSSRSIAFFATGIHALSSLLQDIDQEAGLEAGLEDQTDHISIGCDGSVINKYPRYMERVQDTLDRMIESEAIRRKKIALSKTQDGAVLGAGIAAALATSESLSP